MVFFSSAVKNRLVGMPVIVLVVIIIGFAHIRPLSVIVILISSLKVDFTTWWISTTVKNRVTGKTMCGLVVNHIGFAHIRPLNIILIWISILKVDFTARSKMMWLEKQYLVQR